MRYSAINEGTRANQGWEVWWNIGTRSTWKMNEETSIDGDTLDQIINRALGRVDDTTIGSYV